MDTLESKVRSELFALKDEKYRAFFKKLVPTVSEDRVIGIRLPALRKYAKELAAQSGTDYLDLLPHLYVEENTLHALLICGINDIDAALQRTEEFLPHIDNWATCDSFMPKIFKKHPDAVYHQAVEWLASDRCYTVRYAFVILLNNYLDEHFRPEMPELASKVRSSEYYINMAAAWYFSTALVKQYDSTLPYLQERRLDRWVHNKAIQKAVESFRIPQERKEYLRKLKY